MMVVIWLVVMPSVANLSRNMSPNCCSTGNVVSWKEDVNGEESFIGIGV